MGPARAQNVASWPSAPWTRGSCGGSPAAGSTPPSPRTPRAPSASTSRSSPGTASWPPRSACRWRFCPDLRPSAGVFGETAAGGAPARRHSHHRHRRGSAGGAVRPELPRAGHRPRTPTAPAASSSSTRARARWPPPTGSSPRWRGRWAARHLRARGQRLHRGRGRPVAARRPRHHRPGRRRRRRWRSRCPTRAASTWCPPSSGSARRTGIPTRAAPSSASRGGPGARTWPGRRWKPSPIRAATCSTPWPRTPARPFEPLRVDGGAAANDFLCQFQADMLGVEVLRPAVTETTGLGAAYLAGVGAGLWKPADLGTRWRLDRRFTPAASPAAARDLAYRGWRRAVERARAWVEPGDMTSKGGPHDPDHRLLARPARPRRARRPRRRAGAHRGRAGPHHAGVEVHPRRRAQGLRGLRQGEVERHREGERHSRRHAGGLRPRSRSGRASPRWTSSGAGSRRCSRSSPSRSSCRRWRSPRRPGTRFPPPSASPSPSRSRTRTATGWAPRWSPTGSSITRAGCSASACPSRRSGRISSTPSSRARWPSARPPAPRRRTRPTR